MSMVVAQESDGRYGGAAHAPPKHIGLASIELRKGGRTTHRAGVVANTQGKRIKQNATVTLKVIIAETVGQMEHFQG